MPVIRLSKPYPHHNPSSGSSTMHMNVAFDVVLGLVFIFFLYSLLASIIQEILARWFGLRARLLLKALRRMLEDEDKTFDFTIVNFFIDMGTNFVDYVRPLKKGTFLKAFYEQPTIKYLGENRTNSKPSYLEPSSFSKTIIHILRGNGYTQSLSPMQVIRANLSHGHLDGFTISPQTLNQLTRHWIDANNDIDAFDAILEDWFNQTMDRATGWYKKQTQLLLFLIGLALAFAFNVDSIAITKVLANNETARNQLVNLALQHQSRNLQSTPNDPAGNDQEIKQKTISQFETVREEQLTEILQNYKTDAQTTQQILGLGYYTDVPKDVKKRYQPSLGIALIGWLLTALAISLGAPFWFDLLNKIMMMRNAVDLSTEDKKRTNQSPPPIQPVG